MKSSINIDEVLTVEATGTGGTNPGWDALIAKAAGTGVRGGSSAGDGVQGISSSATGRGLYGSNVSIIAIAGYKNVADSINHRKPTLYLIQGNVSGDYVVGAGSYYKTQNFWMDWFAPMTGTGGVSISPNFSMNLTVGQTITGHVVSTGFAVNLGYWQNWDPLSVFLPIIVKQ